VKAPDTPAAQRSPAASPWSALRSEVFRYLWIVQVRVQGEDPSAVLLKDRPLLLNVVLWALVVSLVLYVR